MRNRFILMVLAIVLIAVVAALPASAQFTKQTSGSTSTLYNVKAVNDTVVWVAGLGGTLLRTTDGGTTWAKLTGPFSSDDVYSVEALDDQTAWIATQPAAGGMAIYKTTDGGTTWATQTTVAGSFPDGIRFYDANNGIAYGDPTPANRFVVLTTTDGGTNWNRVDTTNVPPADAANAEFGLTNGLNIYGSSYAWFVTGSDNSPFNPRVYRSTDAGQTWTASAPLTGFDSDYMYGPAVKDQNTLVVVGLGGKGAVSTDGGVIWTVFPIDVNYGLRWVEFIKGTPSTWVAMGGPTSAGVFFKSTNDGATWTSVALPAGTPRVRGSSFVSSKLGWAAGNSGTVLKWTGYDLSKPTAKVTFMANTSTVPDTLPLSGQTVQIRGGTSNAGSWSPITWGNDAQNNLSAVGGDYWKKTFEMQVGDTLRYKYVFNSPVGTGWEKGVVPADFPAETDANRSFIVPAQDSTLAVEFWNNGPGDRAQYFRPWSAPDDTFMVVYFRVNMLGPMASGSYGPYNNDTDTLAVRGGGPAGGDLNWSPSFYLTRETDVSNQPSAVTVNPLSFWSGALRLPKSGLTAGSSIGYKFLIGSDWNRPSGSKADEGTDRTFKVPVGLKDTTLNWVFFNNERPTSRANPDTVRIRYTANLAQAIQTGGFKLDDTLYVRSGFNATAQDQNRRKTMTRLSGTLFQVIDTIITAKGQLLDYQYYVQRGSAEQRENYYNFLWTGTPVGRAERRQVTVPNDVSLTNTLVVLDTSTSITQARRMPVFPNARPLARNVKVTYTVDVRPAYYQVLAGDTLTDIQGTNPVEPGDKDSIFIWGVWMNGLAVGDWSNPGGDWGLGLRNNLEKKMYDDGTNGDVTAGDSIYSRIVYVGPDSTRGTMGRVGQIFKFGIYGGDNEGGRGGYGNNHNENVVDDDSVYTLESQFGSINPAFYDAWDYDNQRPSGVVSVGDEVQPLVFALAQNYPNPFNPATRIEYSIPVQSQVELKIYNIVGQEVATLVNEIQKPGVHSVKFDASKLATGVYLYRLTAGNFVSTRKMILVK